MKKKSKNDNALKKATAKMKPKDVTQKYLTEVFESIIKIVNFQHSYTGSETFGVQKFLLTSL